VRYPSGHLLDAYSLVSRVRSLSIVLEGVRAVLPHRDLTNEQAKELTSIAEGCHNVLKALDKTLERYQELGSDTKDCDLKSFRFKVRRGWKRLVLEPEDLKELRNRITSNITLLNAFNERVTKYLPTPLSKDELAKRIQASC
jgi:hypothetical protein